jgi:predicted acylesterase/phospholipase RssA
MLAMLWNTLVEQPSASGELSGVPIETPTRRKLLAGASAGAAVLALGWAAPAVAQIASRRALVLSGGGAHGAYEAGVIAGLVQTGALDAYDIICGTSIGSLNAALVATGQGPAVRRLWSSIAQANILRPKREFAAFDPGRSSVARGIAALRFLYGAVRGRVTGFIDPSSLHALIAQWIMTPSGSARPFTRPLLWTATDLTNARGVGFMREATTTLPGRVFPALNDITPPGTEPPLVSRVADRDLASALQASAAIPGAFDPVTLSSGAATLVDGGVLNNTPLHLAQYAGATQIDTVVLVPPAAGASAFPNALAVVEKSYEIMRQQIVDDAILLALLRSDPAIRAAIQRALAQGPLAAAASPALRQLFHGADAPVALRIITPSQPLAGSGFSANDQSLIDQNLDLGYNDLLRRGFQSISTPLA